MRCADRSRVLQSTGAWGFVLVLREPGPADRYMEFCLLAHVGRLGQQVHGVLCTCHRGARSAVAISGQGGTRPTRICTRLTVHGVVPLFRVRHQRKLERRCTPMSRAGTTCVPIADRYMYMGFYHRRIRDAPGEANCIFNLGENAYATVDHAEAAALFDQAPVLYRIRTDLLGEAKCILRLGHIARSKSDYPTAETHFNKALAQYSHIGNNQGCTNSIHSLGLVALAGMDLAAAETQFEQVLVLCERIGDVVGEANGLHHLGEARRLGSDYATATARFDQALARYRRIGNVQGEAYCLYSIGTVARSRSEHKAAIDWYDRALILYQRIGARHAVARTMVDRGWSIQAMGGPKRGFTEIEAALSLYFESASLDDRALPGWRSRYEALTCGDPSEAARHRDEARAC
jgi:tetratricopeptide (TPR) repeat protein